VILSDPVEAPDERFVFANASDSQVIQNDDHQRKCRRDLKTGLCPFETHVGKIEKNTEKSQQEDDGEHQNPDLGDPLPVKENYSHVQGDDDDQKNNQGQSVVYQFLPLMDPAYVKKIDDPPARNVGKGQPQQQTCQKNGDQQVNCLNTLYHDFFMQK